MASITKTRSGVWRARVRKHGVNLSKNFRLKAQAERWAKRQEISAEDNTYRDPTDPAGFKMAELLDRYGVEISPNKRGHAGEVSRLRVLDRGLGRYTLAELTPQRIVDYVLERKQTVKDSTINRELVVLRGVLQAAQLVWHIEIAQDPMPAARASLRVSRELGPGEERDRILEPEEVARILPHLTDQMRDIVRFALETGMRRSEILRVREQDIVGDTLRIPVAKTGPRTIPLSEPALELLRARPVGEDGRLFTLSPKRVSTAFKDACDKAGVEDAHFHDCRHTAATALFARGFNIIEVAAITGHADLRSLKRYTKVKPEELAKKLREK